MGNQFSYSTCQSKHYYKTPPVDGRRGRASIRLLVLAKGYPRIEGDMQCLHQSNSNQWHFTLQQSNLDWYGPTHHVPIHSLNEYKGKLLSYKYLIYPIPLTAVVLFVCIRGIWYVSPNARHLHKLRCRKHSCLILHCIQWCTRGKDMKSIPPLHIVTTQRESRRSQEEDEAMAPGHQCTRTGQSCSLEETAFSARIWLWACKSHTMGVSRGTVLLKHWDWTLVRNKRSKKQ